MVDAFEHTPPPIPDLKKLWAEWDDATTKDGPEPLRTNNKTGEDIQAIPSGRGTTAKTPPDTLLKLKLAVFKEVITFCSTDDGTEKPEEILADLRSCRVEKFALDHRIKRAVEGKEAANEKYKGGNRIGAMYTYAVAWSLLLPYHPDADGVSEDYQKEVGKVEAALFSNISAMALMHIKDRTSSNANANANPDPNATNTSTNPAPPATTDDGPISLPLGALETLAQIGLDASEVCISLPEHITVGIMVKSCRRARELCSKFQERPIPADKIRFFIEQEEILKGMDEKELFANVPKNKVAKPARV